MAKRDGEVTFKGRSWEWGKPAGGSTGVDHPFRRKSQKAVDKFQRRVAEEAALNTRVLESFGIEANLEGDTPLEYALAFGELDRFVEDHKLEHAGVDVVLSRFEGARHDHDEYDNQRGGE